MRDATYARGARIVSFIDIGTNSIRLLVVRINKDCSYTILSRQKQRVRLGEGEYPDNVLQDEAMDRAVQVTAQFIRLGRSFGTEEVVAVATSATRDAINSDIFLGRLRRETHVDVRVISGREEARLIYLGVSSGINLGNEHALFIDIGGGSTEIAIGSQSNHFFLDSMDMGSIRLSERFFPEKNTHEVNDTQYQRICGYIRDAAAGTLRESRQYRIDCAIGSSGTIVNLGEIARRLFPGRGDDDTVYISRDEVASVSALLCSLPLKERKKVPGINPDRADIIICGAAILETVLTELDIDRIAVSNNGLQDGLIVDYLSQMEHFLAISELSVRKRSILQTGRSYGINEFHARNVTRIALGLYDSACGLDLCQADSYQRELLEYASFLHDIGSFISYGNHHLHSAYIIANTDIPGFTRNEIIIMANIARHHRKKLPSRKDPDMSSLDNGAREQVIRLSVFLRLAESLDRSHMGLITSAVFTVAMDHRVVMTVQAPEDCHLEIQGAENEITPFEKIFSKKLHIEIDLSPLPAG